MLSPTMIEFSKNNNCKYTLYSRNKLSKNPKPKEIYYLSMTTFNIKLKCHEMNGHFSCSYTRSRLYACMHHASNSLSLRLAAFVVWFVEISDTDKIRKKSAAERVKCYTYSTLEFFFLIFIELNITIKRRFQCI
jgi:hypothetical protein